jgi:hypothetical protein
MAFVFSTFTMSPCSSQNCWSMFNYCCSITSDSDVKTKSSTKSSNHTCTLAKAGASHFLPSKCPSRASKYNPNSRGLRGQLCFTPCWHLKLEVTPLLGWLMRMVSLAYIACKHRKKCPLPWSQPTPAITPHMAQYQTSFWNLQNNNRMVFFCLALFYQSSHYEELVSNVVIFPKPNLTLSM